MIFGKKSIMKKLQNIEIRVGNFKLELVSPFRYLGMTLDENLNFIQHINNMKKNVCHKIYILRRFSKYMTDAIRLLIYKSHILPIIEYGDIIYMKSHKNIWISCKGYRIYPSKFVFMYIRELAQMSYVKCQI